MDINQPKSQAAYDPIFGQYDIMEKTIKELVKHIPVNHEEVYYLMEVKKQEQVMEILLAMSFTICLLVFIFNLM
jgi:hypothetical protein